MTDLRQPAAFGTDQLELLYPELRRLARRERFRVGRPASPQTTSLIHEAWLKLNGSHGWNDRGHFLCSAAMAMRHVLVDAARKRMRLKRDAVLQTELSDDLLVDAMMPDPELVQLDAAVERLAVFDGRLASVVECRFFAGYTDAETAEALKVNERTVRRDWTKAKAWLYREMAA